MPVVLVVDDDPDVRQFVADVLELEGYGVRLAADGQEALESVQEVRPDCIVLDATMPRLNGYQFLARFRAADGGAELPVVMVTAAAGEQQSWEAWTFGVDFVLPKPFEAARLVQVLTHLVGPSAERSDARA